MQSVKLTGKYAPAVRKGRARGSKYESYLDGWENLDFGTGRAEKVPSEEDAIRMAGGIRGFYNRMRSEGHEYPGFRCYHVENDGVFHVVVSKTREALEAAQRRAANKAARLAEAEAAENTDDGDNSE